MMSFWEAAQRKMAEIEREREKKKLQQQQQQ